MRAIQVREFGGPEVLEPAVLSDPVPTHDELLTVSAKTGVGADVGTANDTLAAP